MAAKYFLRPDRQESDKEEELEFIKNKRDKIFNSKNIIN